MLIAREEWDDRLDFYRPSGISKTWDTDDHEIKYPHTLGEYLTKDLLPNDRKPTNDLKNFVHREFENAIYLDKEQLIDSTKYFYVINVYEPLYFRYNEKVGFKNIDERILEDVRKGNCKIIITHDVEGYSGVEDTGNEYDFKVMHDWAIESNIDPKSVFYINGNMISETIAKRQQSDINIFPVTVQEAWNPIWNFKEDPVTYEPVDSKYLFLNYCRRPRTHRVYVNACLIRDGLFDLGKNSFNALGPWHEGHLTRLDPHIMPYVQELYAKSPLLIDKDNTHNDITVHVPLNDYSSTFINLVGETLYSSNTLFLSEKTWKPMIVGSPFIIVGSPGVLRYLKNEGFRTFDRWIDESYDNEINHAKRFNKIVNLIRDLSKKPIKELVQIRKEMMEVCFHNKELMKVRTREKFLNEKGKYIHHKPTSDILNQLWRNFNKSLI